MALIFANYLPLDLGYQERGQADQKGGGASQADQEEYRASQVDQKGRGASQVDQEGREIWFNILACPTCFLTNFRFPIPSSLAND